MVEATTEEITAPVTEQAAAVPEEEKKEPATAEVETAQTPLSSVTSSGVTPLPKTLRGQFQYGQSLKEEGNLYFKQQDYANAIKKYARVRAFLKPMIPSGDQDNAQFLQMISSQSDNVDDKLTQEEAKQAI